jgi:hypothetical protein
MTVLQMHTAFRLHLDKSTSLVGNPDFLPEEIDFWINEAQDRFIKQRMFGNNYKQLAFEHDQKRMDDLRDLLIYMPSLTLNASLIGSNVRECLLPITDAVSPYMFYVSSKLTNYTGDTIQVKDIIQHDNLKDYIKDSINNPYIRRPLVMFYGDKIAFVYGDEFGIPSSCDITYIKKPKKLVNGTPGTYETNTCELAQHTHNEIVILAVDLVVENIESPRVQTFEQLNASRIE